MTYRDFEITEREFSGKIMYSPESKIHGWMGLYKSMFAAQDAVDIFYDKNKIINMDYKKC